LAVERRQGAIENVERAELLFLGREREAKEKQQGKSSEATTH